MVSWITSNGAGDVRQKSHEQRRWGRTICFVKIVNGAGATSMFFFEEKNMGAAKEFAVDKSTHMVQIVKIAADVRQSPCASLFSAQTCEKKMNFSRWIFRTKKKVKIILVLLVFLRFQAIQKQRFC